MFATILGNVAYLIIPRMIKKIELWKDYEIFFLFYTFEKISYYHSHGKLVIITRIIMLIFRKEGHKHLSLGFNLF